MWRTSSVPHRLARPLAMILVGLSLLPARASGQEGTATIIGRVVDEGKGVLPGVTVTATSSALQVPQVMAVTDERGEYRLTPLPIGTYAVTYELTGFQTVRREGVRLTSGFTARIDAELKVGQIEETVTVSAAGPVVDVKATAATTLLTRETLDVIPTVRTGYNALLAQAPGVRDNLAAEAPNSLVTFRAFGQSGQSFQALDGVVTANPKSDTQSGNYVDFSIFEEAVIQTLGHDASVPTRGIAINAIVKSGGNEFHGVVFTGGTNHRFQSDNLDDALRAQDIGSGDRLALRDDYNADVGGRLVRDKLWFYVSGRSRRDKQDLAGCLQPAGPPCFSFERAYFFTHKETWQISPSNRVIGMTQFNWRRDIESASATTAWEARTLQKGFNPVWKVEWGGVKGNSLVMTVMVGGWINHSGRFGEEFGDGKPPATDRVTGLTWGTAANMQERNLEDRSNVRGNLGWYKPDWFAGNHELKVGFDYFHANANRSRLSRRAPNYQLVFSNGRADQIATWNTPVHPDAPMHYAATYVQDTWSMGRLTLNLGIRYAYDNGKVAAACREAADPPGHVANPAECFPEVQFPIYQSVSPRTRAVYDLTGDGRTVLKGGWGRFHKLRYSDELHTANRNVIVTTNYRWHDLNGNLDYNDGEVNLDVNPPDFISRTLQGQTGALANGVVNPNERQPYTDEYMLQFERELMADFGIRLTGAHSRTYNEHRLEGSLRPYETFTVPVTNPDPGPDGTPGTADDPGTFITYWEYPAALAGNAFQAPWIVNDPAANQKYSSFEVAVVKRQARRWQLQASYTATKKNIPLRRNVGGGTNFGANTRDPNAEINNSDNTWEWLGRASGAYLFPGDVQVAANFQHRSGEPWARTAQLRGGRTIPSIVLNMEPFGSRRLPHTNRLDFRAEKKLRLGPTKTVSLRANILNALNANTVRSVQSRSGPNFGRVTNILLPRIVDFSIEYAF